MISQGKKDGLWGEVLTAREYRARGYAIVTANYRTRLGEIDIIAHKENVLVFCEVKTRRRSVHGLPREAVDRHKQRRIAAAAMQFVKNNRYYGAIRFDVAEVIWEQDGCPSVTVIENAFDGEEAGAQGV